MPRPLKLVPSMYVVEFEVIYAAVFEARPLDVRRKFEFKVIYAVGVEGRCSSRDVSSSSSNTSLSFQTRAIRFLRRCWHHSSHTPPHLHTLHPKTYEGKGERKRQRERGKEKAKAKKSTHCVFIHGKFPGLESHARLALALAVGFVPSFSASSSAFCFCFYSVFWPSVSISTQLP